MDPVALSELDIAVREGLITEAQRRALAARFTDLSDRTPPSASASVEAKKKFNPIMVLYYIGALLILSAFGWFLGSQWDALGARGILAVSGLYAALFVFAGRHLLRKENFPVAGALLITCAVGMTPLIVWAIESWTGIWPQNDPGAYRNYYPWINGSWIIMELATLATSFYALRKIRFSFLFLPAAIALWFFSMDVAEFFMRSRLGGGDRAWVSVGVGLLILILSRSVEKRVTGMDSFWLYLAGLLAFWGGLTSLPSHGEFGRVVYAGINLGLIGVGIYLNRKTFAVFGAMGVYGYVGHLAWSVFKNSPAFPLVLAFVGLMMILTTVLFQKNQGRLRRWMGLPS